MSCKIDFNIGSNVYKNIQCNIAWKALKRNGLRDDDQITASILSTKYPAIHCDALSSKTLLTVLKCQGSEEEKTCSIFLKKLENQGKCARIVDLAFREWFAGNILNMENPIP